MVLLILGKAKFSLIPVILGCMFPSWCVSGVGLRKIKRVMERRTKGVRFKREALELGTMGSKISELERMLIAKIQYR